MYLCNPISQTCTNKYQKFLYEIIQCNPIWPEFEVDATIDATLDATLDATIGNVASFKS